MAVVWSKSVAGTQFEVRQAGRSVRLYTDGVFHSQYNPGRPVTATVWDLLLLPAFFAPPESTKRVLVLGVGGGAVVQLLKRFIQPREIVGVELSEVHLYIAKRFFGLGGRELRLVHADAVNWLRHYDGAPFDLIIDDLFHEQDGEPVRAVAADKRWLNTLRRHLATNGTLVMNFVSGTSLRDAARTIETTLPHRFECGFQLTLPAYDNAIGAFLTYPATTRTLRQALSATRAPRRIPLTRLPYRIRTLL